MVDLVNILLNNHMDQLDRFLNAIAELSDEDLRANIHERYLKKNIASPNLFQVINGLFTRESFDRLVYFRVWEDLEGVGLSGAVLDRIVRNFFDKGLLCNVTEQYFQIHKAVKHFSESGNLHFFILGLPHVAKVMRRAVPAINVTDCDGNINCGSGVLLHSNQKGVGLILTNRHVIQGKSEISVNLDGDVCQIVSSPIFHERADLAKFNIVMPESVPVVNLALGGTVLDKVVAMGYPRIPTSVIQSVFAHQGEINGTVETFDGEKYYAISCHVSPGNSGGPIFNEHGYCVGLVTQSGSAQYAEFEEMQEQYSVTYHMALQVEVIREFVS